MGVERLCEGANFQIPFSADEINLFYQFGEQSKVETWASLFAILPQVKDTLVAEFPETYKLTGQGEVSKTYFFPKSHVSYRKPRAVSNEQRERARQMMIKRNKAKEVAQNRRFALNILLLFPFIAYIL